MVYCLYQRLDWIFQQQQKKKHSFANYVCMYGKKISNWFFLALLIIYFLIFNFQVLP